MCQVLHQIHPFYRHSSDRKKHPHPHLKTRFLTHCRHTCGCSTSSYHNFLRIFTAQHCLGLRGEEAACRSPFNPPSGVDVGRSTSLWGET